MKRSSYIIAFFVLSGIFVIAYFVCYQYGAHMGSDNIRLENDEYLKNPILSEKSTAYVNAGDEPVITNKTLCIMEYYDGLADSETVESVFTPEYFGMNRIEYLETLADNMTLLSFTEDSVAVRVSEDKKDIIYNYFLILENNQISVYKSDKKTLYFNTTIRTTDLDNSELAELTHGKYISDVDELYNFLESHTS